MTDFITYKKDGWHGKIRNDWQGIFSSLDEWDIANPGQVIVSYPSRIVRRVETPQGAVYVKYFFGVTERFSLVRLLRWYVRCSRALQILAISKKLLASGLCCPEPLLAARRRNVWGWPTDVFITLETAAQPLNKLLRQAEKPADRQVLLDFAARAVQQLHARGFVHGDCLPGNICANGEQPCFLDNDRTCTAGLEFSYAKLRNLAQFCRHLPDCSKTPKADGDFFLQAYARYANWSEDQLAEITEKVARKI